MKGKNSKSAFFAVVCLFLGVACNCTGVTKSELEVTPDQSQPEQPQQPDEADPETVVVYTTCSDRTVLFKKSFTERRESGTMSPNKIEYDKTEFLSEPVAGYGFAFTTATCYNLLQMSEKDRRSVLEETFSPEKGVGSSLIRVSMGASDFCISEEYTWCDRKGLDNFKVHPEDEKYLFPVLKEIYSINPEVKIIASPWSCPRWMKGRDSEKNDPKVMEIDYPSWTSGRLKPSCYEVYAEYFVKWVRTMKENGFEIYAVTMQNEPLNKGNSMSLYMPWQDQKQFIKVLGPALERAGFGDVRILLFDHNYNYDNKPGQIGYPLHIFHDPEASKWASGSAWHNYGGSVSELDNVVSEYPEKEIYFTEASIGTWNYDANGKVGGQFGSCFLWDMENIFMGTMSRGGQGVTYWNYMLDDKRKPHSVHNGACTTCYGGVTVMTPTYTKVVRNSQWYDMAQVSSVIHPGARRIQAQGLEHADGVKYLMYLNTDGTIGAVILNKGKKEQSMVFTNDKFSVKCSVPEKSVVSLLWQE